MLRRRKKRCRTTTTTDENAEWDVSANLVDDTMSSIQLLVNRNKDAFASMGLPPVLLWHQLYSILSNRSFIDQNVHRLRNEGKLVTFKVPSGPEDMAVLCTDTYLAEVEKYRLVFREQLRQRPDDEAISRKLSALTAFERALPHLTSLPTIPLKVLMRAMGTDGTSTEETRGRQLVERVRQLGFLLPTTRLDDEAYSLSVPGIGKLMSAVKKTRALILSTLTRTKYKEMHEQQLQKAKRKHSKFQLEFHLADMEGCGLLRRTKVTSGVLVALVDK